MKKNTTRLLGLLLLLALLVGCGSNDPSSDVKNTTSSPDLQMETTDAPTAAPEVPADPAPTAKANVSGGAVDVDLTQMNSTMVYAEVFSMMSSPADYIGKTVRMCGQFAVYQALPDNPSGVDYYYAVLISDATACCQQGIEFIWSGEHIFPDDYPEVGSEITVTGTFLTYVEDGNIFCYIATDSVEAS